MNSLAPRLAFIVAGKLMDGNAVGLLLVGKVVEVDISAYPK
jgi:hypothetical protein